MTSSHVQNDITVDEFLFLLKRTSLPTIVVEGRDDMIVYRTFEETLEHLNVSVLPVGGRNKVLEIFRRRSEIPSSVILLFIADRDVWVNTGIPSIYENECLLFTSGYSIENDVYMDGELWKLLRSREYTKYKEEIIDFIEWYALALNRHIECPSHSISLHPDYVLNTFERPKLLALEPGESYPSNLRDQIINDKKRLLRGKSLFKLLIRNTNRSGRVPHHSDKSLLEYVAVRPGVLLQNMVVMVEMRIRDLLSTQV